MNLNELSPDLGSKKNRKRRRGSKTFGRGHNGQNARSGATRDPAFEGGQTPLHRRLPKVGMKSKKSLTHQEVRLSEIQAILNKQVEKTVNPIVDWQFLLQNNSIRLSTKTVKVIFSGVLAQPVIIKDLMITKGVRDHIDSLSNLEKE